VLLTVSTRCDHILAASLHDLEREGLGATMKLASARRRHPGV